MSDKTSKKKRCSGYIVSHVHWDREWRYPIWETRLMLVEFMDTLIDLLETNIYDSFLLDGQVSPVIDYLEVKPENKDRISKLVSQGRLLVGPWLTLPDEYPVDGEAMVRNLLWGQRKSRELGRVMKLGYTSFGWGQISQLPQIYNGFGIYTGAVGKRVNKKRAPNSEFIWRSPDGSEMLTTRFGDYGRHNFYFKIHLSSLIGKTTEGPEWKYDRADSGILFHRADKIRMQQDHFRIDEPKKWCKEYITDKVLDNLWKSTDESLMPNDRPMMDGIDYGKPSRFRAEMIKRMNEMDESSERQWIHCSFEKFAEIMNEKIDHSKLKIVEGELRDGPALHITGNALATRLYIKQKNKHAQNLLIRLAEPMTAILKILKIHYPEKLIDKAWEFLLNSHPHDSINAVTQDKTSEDVENRLTQTIDLSNTISEYCMKEIVKRINLSEFDKNDEIIVIFNPLPYTRNEVVQVWITEPLAETHHYLIPENDGYMIYNANGDTVDAQWHSFSEKTYAVSDFNRWHFPYKCKCHRIFFNTGQIPACGYKVFKAGPIKNKNSITTQWTDSMSRTDTLLKTPHVIENKYLHVEMNSNGTFNLTDKETGYVYRNQNYYEDRGEIGNYWFNKRPDFNKVYTSLGCHANIWSEDSGPMYTCLVSEINMPLPANAIPEQSRRGDEIKDLVIRTKLILRRSARYVEIQVDFENCHEYHYLRSMFPTNIRDAVVADVCGHFTVEHRSIRPQGPTNNTIWFDMGTLPQHNFIDISDNKVGIAFLNDSLTEYEVLDNSERTVALSLLRSVKNWIASGQVGSDLPDQKGGHCKRWHKIRYALYPHKGNWKQAKVPLMAELFNVPIIPVQTRSHNGMLNKTFNSFLEIKNTDVRFSCLKKTHDRDSLILRVYNPDDKSIATEIVLGCKIKNVWIANLDEERIEKSTLNSTNSFKVKIPSQKILTLEIEIF